MNEYAGHTPRPWRILWSQNGDAFKIVDDKGRTIVSWTDRLSPIRVKEFKANIQLLIDAPALAARVEELERALRIIADLMKYYPITPAERIMKDMNRIARQALIQEEGETCQDEV